MNKPSNFINRLSFQEYLSLGYIYLILLGLLTEVFYYNFIGINIMDYSSLSDVLLSPIKLLARNVVIVYALLTGFVVLFVYIKWILPKFQGADAAVITPDKLGIAAAIMVLFFYLGLGIGMGSKYGKQLKAGKTMPDHEITFANGENRQVKIMGRNSAYLFQVSKGSTQVAVIPIEGNVVQIVKLGGGR
ncbi:MAG: hypothetical protein V4721_07765 [Bacteroidota bacterium]